MKNQLIVKIVKITFHDEHDTYGYVCKANVWISNTPMQMFMKVWATDESGNNYFFKTSGFKYNKQDGLICGKSFKNNNNWYKVEKKAPVGHKGAAIFDGGSTPNICIETKETATPVITVGDSIEIKGSQSGMGKPNKIYPNGLIFLNRVKLIRIQN